MEYSYKGFTGLVYEYYEGIFYGKVTNLKQDVVTFQSNSYDDCENQFQLSVDDYLDMFNY